MLPPAAPSLDALLHSAANSCGLSTAREHSIVLRDLCAQAADSLVHPAWDAALNIIQDRSERELGDILRFITARFHVLNQLEQVQIARINRQRALTATLDKPRAESLIEAMMRLHSQGITAAQLRDFIAGLDVQPTLTAHPTEAKRRSVLDNLVNVARCTQELDRTDIPPAQRRDISERLEALLGILLTTDDVRPKRLEVLDEVKNGLFFLRSSIWETIPRLMRDLADAANTVFGPGTLDVTQLPPIVRYRTWIGGDRDGNPRVTHTVTAATLATMHATAATLWEDQLLALKQELTISRRCLPVPQWFIDQVDAAGPQFIEESASLEQRQHEPFRIKLMQMRGRVKTDPTYDGATLVADLCYIRDALDEMGLGQIARGGSLTDAIIRARAFGLHLATVDIRQHSRVHEAAVAELLTLSGECNNYASLNESERVALLRTLLLQPRPLRPLECTVSPDTAELLATLATVRTAVTADRRSIRSYVISMTHGLSDILEVLLLLKETGLARATAPGVSTSAPVTLSGTLHIVPLLETIDDLSHATGLLEAMLTCPVYKHYITSVVPQQPRMQPLAQPPMQEVMLGYSDSNKDGGFFMANAALLDAQSSIAQLVTSHGVQLRFFHGRGGTIGRGGGRAGRAILSTPAPARTGRLRFTEQGEVISFRYALPAIAHRHLEQIVNAALLAHAHQHNTTTSTTPPRFLELIDRLAQVSMRTYRTLIDDPHFWSWFASASPISAIAGFPIASRPMMRALGSATDGGQSAFDQLRAIPWVFSWIQMRCLAPGWYGLGTALSQCNETEIDLLRQEYRKGAWLTTVIDNAAQELLRARMPIVHRYAGDSGQRFFNLLHNEYNTTVAHVLNISDKPILGHDSAIITRSIADRNPFTDVLNLIQISLLARRRTLTGEQPIIDQLLLQTISAIAAAMQSTG